MRYALCLALLLGACTYAKEVYTPDGRRGLSIRCGGTLNSWGSCLEKAGEMCKGAGYDVFMRNQETGQVSGLNYNPYAGLQGYSVPTINRELLVACKAG